MSTAGSVLKKIGQVILTAGSVAAEIGGFPFLSTLLSGSKAGGVATAVLGDLGKVAQIVSVIETGFASLGSAPDLGSAKLKAATPMVQQIILDWASSNLPGHDKLKVDATKFSADVSSFTSAFVDILNDFGE